MRRVHRAWRRPARPVVPGARAAGRGRAVETIEGVGGPTALHPVQQALHDAPRPAVRVLHAGDRDVAGGRAARRGLDREAAVDDALGGHALPLHRLRQHPRRDRRRLAGAAGPMAGTRGRAPRPPARRPARAPRRRPPLLTGTGPLRRRPRAARHCCTRRSSAARSPTPSSAASTPPTRSTIAGVVAVLGPDELAARVGGPIPILWQGRATVQQTRHRGLSPTGSATSASRVGVVVATLALRRRGRRRRGRCSTSTQLPGVGGDRRAALAPDAPLLYPERRHQRADAASRRATPPTHVDAVLRGRRAHALACACDVGRVAGAPMECRGHRRRPRRRHGQLTVWMLDPGPARRARRHLRGAAALPQHQIRVITPDVGGGFGVKDHVYEDELLVVPGRRPPGPAGEVDRGPLRVAGRHHAGPRRGVRGRRRVRPRRPTAWPARRCRAQQRLAPLDLRRRAAVRHGRDVPGPYRWDAVRTVGRVVATNRDPDRRLPRASARRRPRSSASGSSTSWPPSSASTRSTCARATSSAPTSSRTRSKTFITFDNGDYHRALRPHPRAGGRVARAARRRPARGASATRSTCRWPASARARPTSSSASTIGALRERAPSGSSPTARCASTSASRRTARATRRRSPSWPPTASASTSTDIELVSRRHRLRARTRPTAPRRRARSRWAAGRCCSRSTRSADQAGRASRPRCSRRTPTTSCSPTARARSPAPTCRSRSPTSRTGPGRASACPPATCPASSRPLAYDPEQCTFSYATHVCRVAVDRDTGVAEVERYAVVNDCGTVVNPTIVEGQIHGGVAQGARGRAARGGRVRRRRPAPHARRCSTTCGRVQASIPDIEIEHLETRRPTRPAA